MNILYFDTCFNKSYIVLGADGEVKSKIIENTEKYYHSAFLIPEIKKLLVSKGLFVKDLDAIGVNTGPGSFTGVRAGVTTARVFAQQFNIKLIGIPSLEILSLLNKEKTKTIVTLDARRNSVYFGIYENYRELQAPCLKNKDELISVITPDAKIIADASICGFLAENGITAYNYENSAEDFGVFGFEILKNRLENSENTFNWALVKPLYIQKPSVTKPKEKSNV